MTKRSPLPAEFNSAAFTVADARDAGIGDGRLRARDLARPFRGVRVARDTATLAPNTQPIPTTGSALTTNSVNSRGIARYSELDRNNDACADDARSDETHADRIARRRALIENYRPRLASGQYFSHCSAATVLGIPLPFRLGSRPIDVASQSPFQPPRTAGVRGHKLATGSVRIMFYDGIPVASPLDTWLQLGVYLYADELVAAGDYLVSPRRQENWTPERLADVRTRQDCGGGETLGQAQLGIGSVGIGSVDAGSVGAGSVGVGPPGVGPPGVGPGGVGPGGVGPGGAGLGGAGLGGAGPGGAGLGGAGPCSFGPLAIDDLVRGTTRNWGARGIRRIREALPFVRVGSESPKETALRLILQAAGLPEPELNVEITTEYGEWIARGDLVYVNQRVLVEYDGDQHRTDRAQFERDVNRLDRLAASGWRVVRILDGDLRAAPARVVARVVEALRLSL